MPQFLSITEAADELTEQTGQPVKPRQISALLYDRELRADYCPKIGHRHVIMEDYLPEIARIMRRKGWLRREVASDLERRGVKVLLEVKQ